MAVTVEEDKIAKSNLSDVVMTRKTNLGRKPRVTGTEMSKEWKEEASVWNAPLRTPSDIEKKFMLALAVSEDVRYTMEHHVFRFRDKIYKQEDGGSIGNELTGIVAKTRVILFIRKLNIKLAEYGVKVYLVKASVDDFFLADKKLERGMTVDIRNECLCSTNVFPLM